MSLWQTLIARSMLEPKRVDNIYAHHFFCEGKREEQAPIYFDFLVAPHIQGILGAALLIGADSSYRSLRLSLSDWVFGFGRFRDVTKKRQ